MISSMVGLRNLKKADSVNAEFTFGGMPSDMVVTSTTGCKDVKRSNHKKEVLIIKIFSYKYCIMISFCYYFGNIQLEKEGKEHLPNSIELM
ncbi:hypothetical protein NST77_07390 [Niallia sp. FSL W8-0177]|uniref:hypothetical protein n=1 Tax=Niallia sp. FSL W8-0177 TaxID=2954522 RepID=UPI0030F6A0F0